MTFNHPTMSDFLPVAYYCLNLDGTMREKTATIFFSPAGKVMKTTTNFWDIMEYPDTVEIRFVQAYIFVNHKRLQITLIFILLVVHTEGNITNQTTGVSWLRKKIQMKRRRQSTLKPKRLYTVLNILVHSLTEQTWKHLNNSVSLVVYHLMELVWARLLM